MNRQTRRRAAKQSELVNENGATVAFRHIHRLQFTVIDGESVLMIGGEGQDRKPLVLVLPQEQVAEIINAVATANKQPAAANASAGLH